MNDFRKKRGLRMLAENLQAGDRSLEDSLRGWKERLEKWNPRLFAFLEGEDSTDRSARLRREAKELEAGFPDPDSRPPLYGVPVGVKDIINVEGMATRAGSRLAEEIFAGPEAACVSALKKAGALILGKTVTTEFAYFAPGPTRNPYHLKHTPGGSSSGSAAAVAAGLCPLALGSQTIGSIIRPAAFCGVVGFKPSFGRIATDGVLPLSPSLDHIGFFTPDVDSAEFAASVLCRRWSAGSDSARSVIVVGAPGGAYLERASAEGLTYFLAACKKLEKAGFEIRSVSAMADFDKVVQNHLLLMAAEMAEVHRTWFTRYRDLYHQKTAGMILKGRKVSPEQREEGLAGREKLRRHMMDLMVKHRVTAWLAPAATGPAPAGLGSTGDPIMNLPWTYAGLPAVSVPSGLAKNGLPVGLQLIGRWQGDEALLRLAARVEQVLGPLPPPRLPT